MKRNGRLLFFLLFLVGMVTAGGVWLMRADVPVERRTVVKQADVQLFLKRDAAPEATAQPQR